MSDTTSVNAAFASLMQATTQFSKILKESSSKARENQRRAERAKADAVKRKNIIIISYLMEDVSFTVDWIAEKLAAAFDAISKEHAKSQAEVAEKAASACAVASKAARNVDKAAAAYETAVQQALSVFKDACSSALKDVEAEGSKRMLLDVEVALRKTTDNHLADCRTEFDALREKHMRSVTDFVEQLKPMYTALVAEVE